MSFMTLPLEICQMIYRLVLVQPVQPVLMVKKLGSVACKRGCNKRIPLHPKQQSHIGSSKSIVAVCRAIYNEAHRFYYHDNHFLTYTSSKRIEQFLKSLGLSARHEITKLTIIVPTVARNIVSPFLCTLLKDCIRLSSLRLHYEGWKAADQLGGITRLLELRGMETASLTRRRSRASYNEQCQQDAAPPFPTAHSCVEMQEELAFELRAAWLGPRPKCWKCDGIGLAC